MLRAHHRAVHAGAGDDDAHRDQQRVQRHGVDAHALRLEERDGDGESRRVSQRSTLVSGAGEIAIQGFEVFG